MNAKTPYLKAFPGANGVLELDLGAAGAWKKLTFVGGPFLKYENNKSEVPFGVCLRAEKKHPCDVYLPIQDFSVPACDNTTREAVLKAFNAALDGKYVYIGCMGGWGRTGLFMSLLAKASGVENPVEYVRANYTSKAVETAEQYEFVEDFDVSPIRRAILWKAWKTRFPLLKIFDRF